MVSHAAPHAAPKESASARTGRRQPLAIMTDAAAERGAPATALATRPTNGTSAVDLADAALADAMRRKKDNDADDGLGARALPGVQERALATRPRRRRGAAAADDDGSDDGSDDDSDDDDGGDHSSEESESESDDDDDDDDDGGGDQRQRRPSAQSSRGGVSAGRGRALAGQRGAGSSQPGRAAPQARARGEAAPSAAPPPPSKGSFFQETLRAFGLD